MGVEPGSATAEGASPPEGSGRDAAVLLAVALSMVNVGFYVASIGVVLVVLAGDLGVSVESLAAFGSIFGWGLFAMAALGPFALRLGATRVLAGAAALLAVGTLIVALTGNATLAYVGAVLQGTGAAGMVLVAPRLLRGPRAEARLTGVNAAASLAGIAAPLLLGAATRLGLGGRTPLVAMAAACLVLIVVALRLGDVDVDGPHGATPGQPLAKGTAVRRWLALVCSVSVEFCFVVWGVARLTATGLETGLAAILGASFQVGMALGRLLGPKVIGRIPVVTVGCALAAGGVLLVVVSGTWPLVALGQLVAGLGVATMYPVALARLMVTPGLRPEFGASLGVLGSATAITLAPTMLAGLALVVDLRVAFLVALPILVVLFFLHRERALRPAGA